MNTTGERERKQLRRTPPFAGKCKVCGTQILKNSGKWRHGNTQRNGYPWDHKAVLSTRGRLR